MKTTQLMKSAIYWHLVVSCTFKTLNSARFYVINLSGFMRKVKWDTDTVKIIKFTQVICAGMVCLELGMFIPYSISFIWHKHDLWQLLSFALLLCVPKLLRQQMKIKVFSTTISENLLSYSAINNLTVLSLFVICVVWCVDILQIDFPLGAMKLPLTI